MNGDTAISLVMSRLGNRTEAALREIVAAEMEIVQSDLLSQLDFRPWFLQETASLATVALSETLTLPSNFLGFDEDWGGLWLLDPDLDVSDPYVKLEKSRYADFVQAYRVAEMATGKPEVFDLANLTAYLRPIPNAVYLLRCLYYKRDEAPSDTTATNLWLTHAAKLLVAETSRVVAVGHIHDNDLAASLQTEIADATKSLRTQNEMRIHEQMSYSMGESE